MIKQLDKKDWQQAIGDIKGEQICFIQHKTKTHARPSAQIYTVNKEYDKIALMMYSEFCKPSEVICLDKVRFTVGHFKSMRKK